MKSKKYRYGRYFLLRKFEILIQNNIFIWYIFFNILELKDLIKLLKKIKLINLHLYFINDLWNYICFIDEDNYFIKNV